MKIDLFLRVTHNCHDPSSRFVRLLATNGRNYLVEEDLEVLVQVCGGGGGKKREGWGGEGGREG